MLLGLFRPSKRLFTSLSEQEILAIAIAASGYVLAALLWRLWRGNKWRRRQSRRGARA